MVHGCDEERAALSRSASKLSQIAEPLTGKVGPRPSQRTPISSPICDRDDSDPYRRTVELVQLGRLIVDVSSADLDAAETAFGPFHPTTWHFRNCLNEARRSWDQLRAEVGTKAIEAALKQPPLAVLRLGETPNGSPQILLVLIAGQTYRAQQVAGTELAPTQWRLTRLHPPLENGPYYVCRLADRSTQCDCADWIYKIAATGDVSKTHCKHLAALSALGWI